MSSMILALDTSTLTASAAVVDADGAVRAQATGDPTVHTDRVLEWCADVLARAGVAIADVDAIAVGAGPGSFTGLRIGLATGKGLAYAVGKPLWLASSLAALAWDLAGAIGDAADDGLLVPVLDARRGELYAGFYRRRGGVIEAVGVERVMPPAELVAAIAAHGGAAHVGGDALRVHAEPLAALPDGVRCWPGAPATPSAIGVARAALAGDRIDRLIAGAPAYIRLSEAEVKYPHGVPGAVKP
jgi:tRNA threonylcarbamoyladenosine biosynthesis protein TsaB